MGVVEGNSGWAAGGCNALARAFKFIRTEVNKSVGTPGGKTEEGPVIFGGNIEDGPAIFWVNIEDGPVIFGGKTADDPPAMVNEGTTA